MTTSRIYVESLDEDTKKSRLGTTQGQIYLLAQAVTQQARRLSESHSVTHTEHQADAILFIYALRGTLQLAALAAALAPSDDAARIRGALAEFNTTVPRSKDARDVLAHLDEYVVGFGRRQEPGDPPVLPWFSRREADYVVRLGDIAINVQAAELAAINLRTTVLLLETREDQF